MTFVLIPGAGGQGAYWHLVTDELRSRSHDALPIDLPADDDNKDIPDYADVVLAAIDSHTDVTVVAQSMGAFTVPLVCDSVAVRMIALVNAMIPAPGERPGDWWAATGQAYARRQMDLRDGRDPDAEFDPFVVFLHDVPPHVIESMQQVREQSGTPFASSWTPGPWPDVPTRVVTGRDDRFFPAAFQRRVAQERLGITCDEMPGGHLLALSQPTELVDRLEAYHLELERSSTRS
jgi:pimeloyl-ACP methyl ester carboxylesterase